MFKFFIVTFKYWILLYFQLISDPETYNLRCCRAIKAIIYNHIHHHHHQNNSNNINIIMITLITVIVIIIIMIIIKKKKKKNSRLSAAAVEVLALY